ncbi:hypothetical protein GW579_04835 [Rahnella sp. Lac-M11]|uniref:Uncharacterized protein n=1 Tax=Rahnella contaminans TaxID=2703882 RepID=A0A6M2B009_9GAMM|nr:hypothetical protein [Rahnella contaminans]NGX86415.1 hypothetical protein [Rahnella contaminans]
MIEVFPCAEAAHMAAFGYRTRKVLVFLLAVRGWDYDREVSVFQEQLSLRGRRRNRPKGESAFPLLDFPTLFQHALRSLAMFQQLRLVPQTPPLRGTLTSGSNLLGKRLSLFLTVHSTSF